MIPMFHYVPTKQNLTSKEIGTYTTYGVTVQDDESRTILSVSDVSPDREFVIGLCDRCNRFQLDPVHLFDAIYDSL